MKIKIALTIAILLSLTSCAVETAAQLDISGTAHLNSAGNTHANPTQLKIYYLRNIEDFQKASFFDLYDTPRKILGTDLVKKVDHVVLPNSKIALPLELNEDVQYIGLLAAFTKLRPEEDWRVIIPVEQLDNVKAIILSNNQVIVELVDPAKPIIIDNSESPAAENEEGGSSNFDLEGLKEKHDEVTESLDVEKFKSKYQTSPSTK